MDKQHANQLLDQLDPSHLDAVVRLLEVNDRQWKRFQMISTLPERDRKAVVRLINSSVAAGASRRIGSVGERNGR
jgi:hypothetical protein